MKISKQRPTANKHLAKLACISLCLLLSGCGNYLISVNENTVYTPPPLFKDFTVTDTALKNCLLQTIEDNQIRNPTKMTRLSCTKAGIHTLQGIAVFDGIKEINLRDNRIEDAGPLYQLTNLQSLLLDNNKLTNIQSILTSPKLETLSLKGNTEILCSDLEQLRKRKKSGFTLPEKCRDK